MAASQEPINGLYYGWAITDGIKNQMDANLLKIGALMNIVAINRTTTSPPGSPSDGDCYIPASGATGVWAGKDGQIAVYRTYITAWEFYPPKNGWTAVVLAESKLIARLSGAWTSGIAL